MQIMKADNKNKNCTDRVAINKLKHNTINYRTFSIFFSFPTEQSETRNINLNVSHTIGQL